MVPIPESTRSSRAACSGGRLAKNARDGRYVLSSFAAEDKSPAWWSSVIGDLKNTYGISVAFIAAIALFAIGVIMKSGGIGGK